MKHMESCQIYIFSALAGPYFGWARCIYVHINTVWRIYTLYIYTDSKVRTTKSGRSNVITLLSQVKWQDHFIYFPCMFSMVVFTFVFNYCSFRKSGAFCSANQLSGFYMMENIGRSWVNNLEPWSNPKAINNVNTWKIIKNVNIPQMNELQDSAIFLQDSSISLFDFWDGIISHSIQPDVTFYENTLIYH